jgi:16S rRNA (uracil1498-N3)-methyltransferase
VVEPLFFLELDPSLKPGTLVELKGQEAKHAISVKRMTLGEAIAISDGHGLMARGKVSEIRKDSMVIDVESVETVSKPLIQITLVQALAKGDRDELAVQAATELGISAVIPWQASRSISRWAGEKQSKGVQRWRSITAEAAKQSLRPLIPEIEFPADTHELIQRLTSFEAVFVLEPSASVSLAKSPKLARSEGKIAVVVGPEGGITPEEIQQFERAGFDIVRLGSGILRTSTAGMAAISYIQAELGNWD